MLTQNFLSAMGGHLRWDAYNLIIEELPRLGMVEGITEIMCHLCRTKPQTTYDNFVGQFGERYVEGFSLKGTQFIDLLEASKLG